MWGIEIRKASWSAMCGSIEFQVLSASRSVDVKAYKVFFNTTDGMRIKKRIGNDEWTQEKWAEHDEIVALLPKKFGWTFETFMAVWAGFGTGYDRGRSMGVK